MGGRGRRHSHQERDLILGLVQEAVDSGARQSVASKLLGLHPRSLQRWRGGGVGDDLRSGPRSSPPNKLPAHERAQILDVVNQPEFRDLSPNQIVPRLADEGRYIASEATMYRVLREEKQLRCRRTSLPPTHHRPRELVATGPRQVWSWDITYLPSTVKGSFFYLHLALDVWSRRIVGWDVQCEENAEHGARLISKACADEGVPRDHLTLHQDNGAPMKAATFLARLQALGVAASFSRPGVSDDNPFVEALFRTFKYRPEYPDRAFRSIEEARAFIAWFVRWYNTEHRHSAIRYVTPDQRHRGDETGLLAKRNAVYARARAKTP